MKKTEKDTIIDVCHKLLDSAIISQNSRIKFPDSEQSGHIKHLFEIIMYCESTLHQLIKP